MMIINIYDTYSLLPFTAMDAQSQPLTNYANDRIFQELPKESNCFSISDERLYIDLRDSNGYTSALENLKEDDINH